MNGYEQGAGLGARSRQRQHRPRRVPWMVGPWVWLAVVTVLAAAAAVVVLVNGMVSLLAHGG